MKSYWNFTWKFLLQIEEISLFKIIDHFQNIELRYKISFMPSVQGNTFQNTCIDSFSENPFEWISICSFRARLRHRFSTEPYEYQEEKKTPHTKFFSFSKEKPWKWKSMSNRSHSHIRRQITAAVLSVLWNVGICVCEVCFHVWCFIVFVGEYGLGVFFSHVFACSEFQFHTNALKRWTWTDLSTL